MKRKALNGKVVVALTVAGLVGSTCALDLPAPGADGKIVLDTENGNYAATANVVCTQVLFSANNISVDLSADGGKTIAVPSTVTTDGFAFSARYLSANVLGGIWDFGGNASMKVGSSNHDGAIVFSGTSVSNVKDVVVGDNKRNCTLTLTDEAKLDAKSLHIVNTGGSACTFEVLGGSTASFSGLCLTEDGRGSAGGNILRIDGAGSTLFVTNKTTTIGRGFPNDRMFILNNARATLQSLLIGAVFTHENSGSTYYATNTVLTVDDGTLTTTESLTIGNGVSGSTGLVNKASLEIGWELKVGAGATAIGNLLSVSGSVVSVDNTLSVGSGGSTGNRAEFRDTTLSASYMRIGLDGTSTGNTLVLAGTTTWTQKKTHSEDNYYPFFFGSSGNNELVLTDGFQFEPQGTYIMSASGNNTVRIRNGAKVEKRARFYIGTQDSKCHDNTYAVEAGGTSVLYRVDLGGFQNRIVVSNGVFQLTRDTTGALYVGCNTVDMDANPTVGCELVLRGTRPQCTSTGETVVYGDGKGIVRFELPDAALETVPMSFGTITFQEGAAIHVACDNYLSYLGKRRANVVLARASTSAKLQIPSSVLAAANAELPDRCSLVVEGTDLVLKVRSGKSLVVSFH